VTAYDRLVMALEAGGFRVVTRGNKTDAQCPAHGSTGLKLGIAPRHDGAGIVVNCISMGCEAGDIMAAVGLTLRDLFDGDLPPGYVPPPRREPTPWDIVIDGPGLEHLLSRMVAEQTLEAEPDLRECARAHGDGCLTCATDELRHT